MALRRSTRQRFVWDPADDDAGIPTIGLFAELAALPPDVRRRLTDRQQRRWMAIANETFAAATGELTQRRAAAVRRANDAFPLR